MADILNMKDDIVNVLFYLNIVLLVIGIFVSSKAYFITVIVINVIFNGTFLVIWKKGYIFQTKQGALGKMFGKLDNTLDHVNNMGNKNG